MTNRYFIAFWCCDGFEVLEDITACQNWEQQQLIDALSDKEIKPNPMNQMITYATLRGRMNSQREYELYAFMANEDINKDDLVDWASKSPQSLVNWIRANGVKLYSDYSRNRKEKIV